MALKDDLVSIKPREGSAGPRSNNRFGFQENLSLLLLIELHKGSNDYLIIFDHHDDIIVLDKCDDPEAVSFYQVKGSEGKPWKLSQLLQREKPEYSIFGKLYYSKILFPTGTKKLTLLSNKGLDEDLETGKKTISKDLIHLIELTKAKRKIIAEKLLEEHPGEKTDEFETITFFRVVDISLRDSTTHLTGEVGIFLEALFGKDNFPAVAFYRTIISEVEKRSKQYDDITSYDQLMRKKGISRTQFNEWLKVKIKLFDYDKIWQSVQTTLQGDPLNFPFGRINKLHQEWKNLEVDLMNPNNSIVQNAKAQLEKILADIKSSEPTWSNWDINTMLRKMTDNFISQADSHLLSQEYLQTISLAILHE